MRLVLTFHGTLGHSRRRTDGCRSYIYRVCCLCGSTCASLAARALGIWHRTVCKGKCVVLIVKDI